MLDSGSPILVLPDLQLPYEHERSLSFAKYVLKHYKIPLNNVLNAGDEVDFYHGGQWDKSPDMGITANQELQLIRDKVAMWADVFPRMLIALSNHGQRYIRKATASQIPAQLIRDHREIIGAPSGWEWKQQFIFSELKHPFMLTHGCGYSGAAASRTMALDNGISVVHGHLHSNAGIHYINTANQQIYGMNCGSLIDVESFAFEYGKASRFKPWIGVAVIFKSGSMPVLIPID